MYEIPLERGKIREFALATRATNEAYDSVHPVTPPTFLTTAMMAWEPAGEPGVYDLGFDLTRLLHGEEEYVFHGPPPHGGQTLTVESRVGDRYEKEGRRGGRMRFAKVIHEFRDADGQLVVEQISTMVETAPATEES